MGLREPSIGSLTHCYIDKNMNEPQEGDPLRINSVDLRENLCFISGVICYLELITRVSGSYMSHMDLGFCTFLFFPFKRFFFFFCWFHKCVKGCI